MLFFPLREFDLQWQQIRKEQPKTDTSLSNEILNFFMLVTVSLINTVMILISQTVAYPIYAFCKAIYRLFEPRRGKVVQGQAHRQARHGPAKRVGIEASRLGLNFLGQFGALLFWAVILVAVVALWLLCLPVAVIAALTGPVLRPVCSLLLAGVFALNAGLLFAPASVGLLAFKPLLAPTLLLQSSGISLTAAAVIASLLGALFLSLGVYEVSAWVFHQFVPPSSRRARRLLNKTPLNSTNPQRLQSQRSPSGGSPGRSVRHLPSPPAKRESPDKDIPLGDRLDNVSTSPPPDVDDVLAHLTINTGPGLEELDPPVPLKTLQISPTGDGPAERSVFAGPSRAGGLTPPNAHAARSLQEAHGSGVVLLSSAAPLQGVPSLASTPKA